MVWFFGKNRDTERTDQERQLQQCHDNANGRAQPEEQDPGLPMDLGSVQDIFSFRFIRGRPMVNFLLAILWSIGLPIVLYHLLRPRIGQVLAMIAASSPPLAIVIMRMLKEKTVDVLGLVAGLSFFISGLISIAKPDDKTSAICESIVPLLVGVFCLASLIPLRIGKFESRPLIYQFANQVMPRQEEDHALDQYDEQRQQQSPTTKRQKLDYLYRTMSPFRRDMRVMTACWGITLIVTFIIKVIVVMTSTDTSHAETVGYIIFGLATGLMIVFSWLYTKVVKRHVTETTKEGLHNTRWTIHAIRNTFGQVIGGG